MGSSASAEFKPVVDVVVTGPPGAGKTSLCMALSGLSKELKPTVQPELYVIDMGDLIVHIWDTPGQGRYSSISNALRHKAALNVSCSSDGHFIETKELKAAIKVRTKNDLNAPWFHADIATSAVTLENVSILRDMMYHELMKDADGKGCGCTGFKAEAKHSTHEAYSIELELR